MGRMDWVSRQIRWLAALRWSPPPPAVAAASRDRWLGDLAAATGLARVGDALVGHPLRVTAGDAVVAEIRVPVRPFGLGPADPESLQPGLGDAAFDERVAIRGHRPYALPWLDAPTRAAVAAAVTGGLRFDGRRWWRCWSGPDLPDPGVVVEALAALRTAAAWLRAPRGLPDLLRLARSDASPAVRRAAWVALAADPRVTDDSLLAALSQEDPAITEPAALALAARPGVDAEAVLLAGPPTLAVLGALRRVATLRAVPHLVAWSKGPRWDPAASEARVVLAEVRARAGAAGRLSEPAAGGALALSDQGSSTRTEATLSV